MSSKQAMAISWTGYVSSDTECDHLRISEVAGGLDDEFDIDLTAARPGHYATQASASTEIAVTSAQDPIQQTYQRSVGNLDVHICGLASAIAALDAVEGQLTMARNHIDELRRRGQPINLRKVEATLQQLAEQVNDAIARVDVHHVNLLRDSRVELRLVELDSGDTRAMGVDLTLISLDKLVAYQLGNTPQRSEDMCRLIDRLSHVVNGNLHILSSLVLMLFASRDYTDEVARLVLNESLAAVPRSAPPLGIGMPSAIDAAFGAHAATNATYFVKNHYRAPAPAPAPEPKPWRRSLTALLSRMQPQSIF